MNLKEKELINELESIIAYADQLIAGANGLKNNAAVPRRKLISLQDGTWPKRSEKKVLSDEVIAKVLAGRQDFINRKANKSNA